MALLIASFPRTVGSFALVVAFCGAQGRVLVAAMPHMVASFALLVASLALMVASSALMVASLAPMVAS